jgi:rhamnose transport system substrate-binding protein
MRLARAALLLTAAILAVGGCDGKKGPPAADGPGRPPAGTGTITLAMMPKSEGNPYFIACKKGADEAAAELGVKLIWKGPTTPDPVAQNAIVDGWITRGVDVIAVAVENRDGMSSVLKKARSKGIQVITWDADTTPDARSFFVNQATPEGIAQTLVDHAAAILNARGEYAIITASLTAGNMIEWQKAIEKYNAEKYPDLKRVALRPCDDKQKKAEDEANTIMNAHPACRLIMAICSPAVPGAADAVEKSGRKDVKVIGLGLPNENKVMVHKGITEKVVLWNTADLGYLTVHAAVALRRGTLKAGDTSVQGGRLGPIEVAGDQILLGKPFTFDRGNIDKFDF